MIKYSKQGDAEPELVQASAISTSCDSSVTGNHDPIDRIDTGQFYELCSCLRSETDRKERCILQK